MNYVCMKHENVCFLYCCTTTALFLEQWVVPPHPNLQVHRYLLLTIF